MGFFSTFALELINGVSLEAKASAVQNPAMTELELL